MGKLKTQALEVQMQNARMQMQMLERAKCYFLQALELLCKVAPLSLLQSY